MSSTVLPPLLGDGHGRYRVHIVGNSAKLQAAASTTGAELARLLGVPFIELDKLNWQTGWAEASIDKFQAKLRAALAQDERGWVVDGSYHKKCGTIVSDTCTDVVWLDPPLALYFPRILLRTLLRLLRVGAPCSPGCDES
ncbi:hypothetical protein H0H81_005452, partial [Sphagnurus paluster]